MSRCSIFIVGKVDKDAWRICLADFVSTEDGTGVVHIAPAFGEDDYNLGSGVRFAYDTAR